LPECKVSSHLSFSDFEPFRERARLTLEPEEEDLRDCAFDDMAGTYDATFTDTGRPGVFGVSNGGSLVIDQVVGKPEYITFAVGINPNIPAKTLPELVAYAKANPGKLNYSTGGAGTLPHLTAELFKQLSGTDIVHVPYKGGGPALTDVVAGQIPINFDTVGTSVQFIRDGRLKALAVSNPTRLAELPDVPTMPELGYPAINSGAWVAVLAPLGTPPAIIARLNQATNDALKSPAMRDPLARLGAQPRGSTPDDLARHMRAEHDKWGPIVARLGLKEE